MGMGVCHMLAEDEGAPYNLVRRPEAIADGGL